MRLEKMEMGSQPLLNHELIKAKTNSENFGIKHSDKMELIVNKAEVKTIVTKLNEFAEPLHADLQFKFHEELNEYYVTVVNPLTNEIIKEIPPKKMLDMYAAMVEFMGILVDKKI